MRYCVSDLTQWHPCTVKGMISSYISTNHKYDGAMTNNYYVRHKNYNISSILDSQCLSCAFLSSFTLGILVQKNHTTQRNFQYFFKKKFK